MTSCETKFNATDYIRVDSRTMHGQEKLGKAVSAGQLIIQLSNSLLAQDCSYHQHCHHNHRCRPHVPPPQKPIPLNGFSLKTNKEINKQTKI